MMKRRYITPTRDAIVDEFIKGGRVIIRRNTEVENLEKLEVRWSE